MATLVCFHAHPDDESIATAGLMALAARAGHRVVLVTATRGELGEIMPGVLEEGEQLGLRRCAELWASAETLGVERIELLGYGDSGMMGEPTNDAPWCFWQADVEAAARRLATILDDEAPDVLTVYDDHGGYGHPDHIQVHRVGMRAAELAGVGAVFQSTMNRDHLSRLIAANAGRDTPRTRRGIGRRHPRVDSRQPGFARIDHQPRGRRPQGDRRQAGVHAVSSESDGSGSLHAGDARRRVRRGDGVRVVHLFDIRRRVGRYHHGALTGRREDDGGIHHAEVRCDDGADRADHDRIAHEHRSRRRGCGRHREAQPDPDGRVPQQLPPAGVPGRVRGAPAGGPRVQSAPELRAPGTGGPVLLAADPPDRARSVRGPGRGEICDAPDP